MLCQLLLLLLISVVSSRGIWGGRRKREEVATDQVNSDEQLKDLLANIHGDVITSTKRKPKFAFDSARIGEISRLIDNYIKVLEDTVNSSSFDEYVTPDIFRNTVKQIPGFSNYPELEAMLESTQFQDPEVFKLTVKQGISLIKQNTAEFIEILGDPQKIEQVWKSFEEIIFIFGCRYCLRSLLMLGN